MAHPDGGEAIDAIAFNVDLNQWPNHRIKTVQAAYKLDINTYQGRTKLQLVIDALQAL